MPFVALDRPFYGAFHRKLGVKTLSWRQGFTARFWNNGWDRRRDP
jgi:hypothetical protein